MGVQIGVWMDVWMGATDKPSSAYPCLAVPFETRANRRRFVRGTRILVDEIDKWFVRGDLPPFPKFYGSLSFRALQNRYTLPTPSAHYIITANE